MSEGPDRHEQRAGSPASPSLVARRWGPVVAGAGLLGAVAALVWFALAPDNVVGPVPAGEPVPAVAVHDASTTDACLELVDGTGGTEQVCLEEVSAGPFESRWEGDRLIVFGGAAPLVVDPATGDTTPLDEGEPIDGGLDGRAVRDVTVEGGQVRVASPGGEGRLLLDVGGPATRLHGAALAPDETWAVATTEDRVLVGRTDDPTVVYEWFTLGDDEPYFDVHGQVRWDE